MYVMVLNDGETYTDLAGCKIIHVPASVFENELDEFVKDAARGHDPEGDSVVHTFGPAFPDRKEQ